MTIGMADREVCLVKDVDQLVTLYITCQVLCNHSFTVSITVTYWAKLFITEAVTEDLEAVL